MAKYRNTVIIGSGHFLPKNVVSNRDFLDKKFYDSKGEIIETPTEVIIEKFQAITEIEERRYIDQDQVNSDIATLAAMSAIEDANIDPNLLDYVFVAHNFGDVKFGSNKTDIMPSLASKVKNKLNITNNQCVPYDMIYGCPGWIEAMRLADNYIKAGLANKILVVGSETLSRVIDPFDRDSMIFADGAGAVVLQAQESDEQFGILHHNSLSFNNEELHYLLNGQSFNPEHKQNEFYIRMFGRKIYEFALSYVPSAIKSMLDEAGKDLSDVSKLLIHQANAKMDEAILKRLLRLYKTTVDEHFMPMTIQKFGNSSVATVPTMFDMVMKGQIANQAINSGDNIVFASVGAGMTINSMLYRVQ